jgi:hypothetical protein
MDPSYFYVIKIEPNAPSAARTAFLFQFNGFGHSFGVFLSGWKIAPKLSLRAGSKHSV